MDSRVRGNDADILDLSVLFFCSIHSCGQHAQQHLVLGEEVPIERRAHMYDNEYGKQAG